MDLHYIKGLILFLLLAAGLTSCVKTGYSPSYVISEVEKDSYYVDE